MMLNPGKIIEFNRKKLFKYIKPLGSGGTGDTHLFEDEITNMKFAINKYSPKGDNDIEENYDRFVDEIKILFTLSHPNIVRIYNYYLYPEQKLGYLQMEFIDGKSIDEFEWMFGKDWNDIFIETVNAFKYLEDKNILHRDIRPQNILIDEKENVKIIDFGFGKKLIRPEDRGESVFLNWPVSEWPEEVEKERIYTAQSEVYFLGKLFSNLPLDEECSFKFHHIVDKMKQVNKTNRYRTFAEVSLAISEGILSTINFSDEEQTIYLNFANCLHSKIACYSSSFSYESNPIIILDNLSEILKVSVLERYLQDNTKLIKCFVSCGYTYYSKKDIETEVVKDFYSFLNRLPLAKQQVVINNIANRLSTIEVKVEEDFEDLPF